jgi:hypothetical protein
VRGKQPSAFCGSNVYATYAGILTGASYATRYASRQINVVGLAVAANPYGLCTTQAFSGKGTLCSHANTCDETSASNTNNFFILIPIF